MRRLTIPHAVPLLLFGLAILTTAGARALAAGCPPEPAGWSYSGKTGPAMWGGLDPAFAVCANGKEQSPIALTAPGGAISYFPRVHFFYGRGAITHLDHNDQTIRNDGAGNYITIGGVRYDLINDHFHTPSEHTLGGKSFPLELHLVHRDAAGKLAVVGIFFTPGKANKGIVELPSIKDYGHIVMKPAALVPRGGKQIRYDGSLTTPPCSQDLTWTVMSQPVEMSLAQIQAIQSAVEGCWGTANNARPMQSLNGRVPK